MPAADILQSALVHHQAGRLQLAETLYRQILETSPNHPDALHFLGVLAHQAGKSDIAVELISQAIHANPSDPTCYNNLGNVLKSLGKLEQALDSYHHVIQLNPDSAEAHYNLGNALRDQGHLDAAIESYRMAISLKPEFADAHSNMGLALNGQGKLDAAIESFRQALRLRPDFAEAYYDMGNLLQEQGKFEQAIISYRKAISLMPDYAEAYLNLGNILILQGKPSEAIVNLRKSLESNPSYAEAHTGLGIALGQLNLLDEALANFHKGLELNPGLSPAYSGLLFFHAYRGTLAPGEYLSLARGWELACVPESERKVARKRRFHRPPLSARRLKIAYVSGDFRQHAVSYFIEQLFAHHDRMRVELYAYSTVGTRDIVTQRIQTLVEHWIPVSGMSDTVLRDRIDADGIDVLIDLSGHTAHNRMEVIARRAAPVQVHYLGYFGSTGLTEMDYFIGDAVLTPPEMDCHFTEQPWRLPRVWISYKTIAEAPEPKWRPDSDGSVWLGSFNDLGKLTPQTLALWAKVLHALPEGRLLLKNKGLADAGNRRRILDALAWHGISSSRVELQHNTEWADYMAQYDRLDIALDPVGGHSGGTTTCDTLWMGVPVIHALGNSVTSRFTASILSSIGHPEWIAHDETDYVNKVVELAKDVKQRQALRSAQRERMAGSPLCNTKDLALKLENAYFEMFERWLGKQDDVTRQE